MQIECRFGQSVSLSMADREEYFLVVLFSNDEKTKTLSVYKCTDWFSPKAGDDIDKLRTVCFQKLLHEMSEKLDMELSKAKALAQSKNGDE